MIYYETLYVIILSASLILLLGFGWMFSFLISTLKEIRDEMKEIKEKL